MRNLNVNPIISSRQKTRSFHSCSEFIYGRIRKIETCPNSQTFFTGMITLKQICRRLNENFQSYNVTAMRTVYVVQHLTWYCSHLLQTGNHVPVLLYSTSYSAVFVPVLFFCQKRSNRNLPHPPGIPLCVNCNKDMASGRIVLTLWMVSKKL